ncbi:MAG TPA: Rpn family recombination-promoting nuclease/putative transposase [Clostridiales bacterium]|nr:Rpn family recombination-promoting nuclease/putative transposase [Clostridiales bacterium]
MDEAIKMAEERTERVAADEEERRFYEALEDWERDRLSLINAVEDAREEGLEKGGEKEKQEIARNSLSLGLPKDVIAKITGLTLQEIENLSKHEE